MRSGCIHPVSAGEDTKDQVFIFDISSLSDSDPEFHWEIMWKVQIIESGVPKGYYYGGFETGLVVLYDAAENTFVYDEESSVDVWDLSDCDTPSPVTLVSGLAVDGYSITDTNKKIVYSSENPFCSYTRAPTFSPTKAPTYRPSTLPSTSPTVLPSLSPTHTPTLSPTVMCPNGLYDGEYLFRATAPESWSFCGVSHWDRIS